VADRQRGAHRAAHRHRGLRPGRITRFSSTAHRARSN
jgi:hypothetical protein